VRLPLGLENRLWENRGQGSGTRDWRLETRDWRLEIRDYGLEIGNWNFGFGRGDCRAFPSLRSGLWLTAMTSGNGLAMTREGTVPVGAIGRFLYRSLRQELRQCDGQKNQSSSEKTKAHAASDFLTFTGSKKACAKYNKEQAKQNRKRSPNCEMLPYIQSSSEQQEKAYCNTNIAVSFRHRAEFSTPKGGRQSE